VLLHFKRGYRSFGNIFDGYLTVRVKDMWREEDPLKIGSVNKTNFSPF
jgi:hypothetical protein